MEVFDRAVEDDESRGPGMEVNQASWNIAVGVSENQIKMLLLIHDTEKWECCSKNKNAGRSKNAQQRN
jgi:hypothetical protein